MLSRNSFLFVVAVILILTTSLAQAFYSDKDGVVNLTPENFKKEVLQYKGPVLVEFYAPWCGHCKALTPQFKAAGEALDGVAKLAAIDADKYGQFASKYGVSGFPTLKWFGANKKQPTDYEGGRKKEDFVADALKQVEAIAKTRLK